MLRIFAVAAFGGGFLLISPKLRMTVESGIESGATYMALYAPWSYCGAVLVAIAFAGITLYRGAQPR